jgi:6-phosphogluconolactonase (cycloisomerase 2 family)
LNTIGAKQAQTIALSAATYATGEGGPAIVIVTRSGNADAASVRYATASQSATAGTDYVVTTGTLNFAAGETSKAIRIAINNDAQVEADETFTLTLSNPTNASLGAPATATVTIVDDDTPSVSGQWSGVSNWPVVPIHIHLLPNGKVLLWDRHGHEWGWDGTPRLWDPQTGAFTTLPAPDYDIFCAGHSFMADGKLLITGGHIPLPPPNDSGVGEDKVSLFDFQTNSFTSLPRMNAGRWYPSNVTLANGDVLTMAGTTVNAHTVNTLPQVWRAANLTWRNLTGATQGDPPGWPVFYPFLYQAPNGRVFCAGPQRMARYLDTAGAGAWTDVAGSSLSYRDYGSSAMYDEGKVLIVGGNPGEPNEAAPTILPSATTEVINLNTGQPAWRRVAPMSVGRRQHNATLLADGKVLVTGGSALPGFDNPAGAVFFAELWDPANETWKPVAGYTRYRGYHSVALLLPDGRVLIAGGGHPDPPGGSAQPNIEIYSPPYLFKGPRPTITGAPAQIAYGQTFRVQTPDAASINGVTLVRLGSVTHSFNQNQRINRLSFTPGSGELNITAPANPNLCPPGHYLLFILNSAGAPSVARVVQITQAAGTCPAISSISTSSGAVGSTVRINGANFSGVTEVRFAPDVVTEFDLVSSGQIAVTVPDGAGSGPITISKDGCADVQTPFFTVLGASAPSLVALSPNSAQVGDPDLTLTLTGTNFNDRSVARWNGADRPTEFVSSARLLVEIPASDLAAPGTASVRVFNPEPGGGLSGALSFTIAPANVCPTVSAIDPTSGPVGSAVTITGASFSGVTAVRFAGNVAAQFTVNSATSITATVPALAAAGPITISKTGCPDAQTASFAICPAITITPTSLPNGAIGAAYNQTLAASGGFPPYSFAVTAGSLPAGLTLATGGALSGAPSVGGTFNFTVTATAANGCRGARSFTLSIPITLGAHTRPLYVLNDSPSGNRIYGFAVNEVTGALSSLPGFPISTGGAGDGFALSEQLTIDRANHRLYAINNGSDTISAYSINPTTGALTPLPFSPISPGSGNWFTIAVHPSGSPLVVGDGNGRLLSYRITATTATAATGAEYNTGSALPLSTVFSQDGVYVYTGGNISNTIASLSVDAATGALTALAGSPFDSGNANPMAYATDAEGRLFVASGSTGQVRVFTTASGIPTAVSGGPFASGLTSPSSGLLHPNGFYLVADRGDFGNPPGNRVGVYRINGSDSATTLTAVAGSPFAAGGEATTALALNQTGTFLFAANGASRNLTTFSVNPATGALTALGAQPANTLGGSGFLSGMAYLASSCPTVAGISPTGAAVGTNITITGAGFTGVTSVKFGGGATAQFSVVSDTQITATVPSGAATGPITISKSDCHEAQTGVFTITQGFEADVAPRPDGNNNGAVTISDWVQAGRFVTGLDVAEAGGEFQRADCAPRETLGDGRLTIADWVQVGRYAAGLDPIVAAGGPTVAASSAPMPSDSSAPAKGQRQAKNEARRTVVRAVISAEATGSERHVTLELDAQGAENALGLSLLFNSAEWRFLSAQLGADASGATLLVNTIAAKQGRLGLALALPAGRTFSTAGRARQFAVLTFAPAPGAKAAALALGFGDDPTPREIADPAARPLEASYTTHGRNLSIFLPAIFLRGFLPAEKWRAEK